MVDKVHTADMKTTGEMPVVPAPTGDAAGAAPAVPAKRSPGHRGADMRDTMAEMAARAQEISLEAGSKIAGAMKDVINAAAGLSGFAIESARDLVQYMVRRGQMTQDEADRVLRDAEEAAKAKRPATATPAARPAAPSPMSAPASAQTAPRAQMPAIKRPVSAAAPTSTAAPARMSVPATREPLKTAPARPAQSKSAPAKAAPARAASTKSGVKAAAKAPAKSAKPAAKRAAPAKAKSAAKPVKAGAKKPAAKKR